MKELNCDQVISEFVDFRGLLGLGKAVDVYALGLDSYDVECWL